MPTDETPAKREPKPLHELKPHFVMPSIEAPFLAGGGPAPDAPAPIRGRWTIATGPEPDDVWLLLPGDDGQDWPNEYTFAAACPVPDEAAIERGAKAVCAVDGGEWEACQFKDIHRQDALAVLRAALEAPDDV